MARKSKSKLRECSGCSSILLDKHTQLHGDQCETLKTESNKLSILTHGLIENDILYADVIIEDCQKGDNKYIAYLPKSTAFLNPSTMKMCKIFYGDRIILTSVTGYQRVCTVLPKVNLPLTTISLMKNYFPLNNNKNIVCVKKYFKYPFKADSLIISCENSNSKDIYSNEFKTLFIEHHKEDYVASGTELTFSYYGRIYQLKIEKIICEHYDEYNQLSTSDCFLTQKMEELNLDESDLSIEASYKSELSEASVMCSTPMNINKKSDLLNIKESPFLMNESIKKDIEETTFFTITSNTNIKFFNEVQDFDESVQKITFDKIGGLEDQISLLKAMIYSIISVNYLGMKGLGMPKGVLLHGPPGTGKSMIGNAIRNEYQANFILVNGAEIYSRYYGESEANLRDIFSEAKRKEPSIIFIDQIDILCPKCQDNSLEIERRVLSTLLTLMDDLNNDTTARVFVIGVTNQPDFMDESLKRAGRFDREIEIGFPNSGERFKILTKLLNEMKHSLTSEEIKEIADKLHGYTGADLDKLIRNANFILMKENVESPVISLNLLSSAMKEMKPSAMKEINIQISKVYWKDIGGMHEVKKKLKQAIEWPLTHPELFCKMGISERHGILMYGPPGCSKTMIAKALATESGLNFISIKGPELFNKYVGESEKSIRRLFQKAKLVAPSIIFFDEIDALAGERSSSEGSNVCDRVLTQLLTEMDGMEQLKHVFIVAATNRPDKIDKALLRPGRLDSIIYVPLPDAESRKEIIEIQFRKMPISSDVDLSLLVERTKGYSGAEIIALCHEAGLMALNEDINAEQIKWSHFRDALKTVTPRTLPETIKYYESYFEKNKNNIKS